MLTPTGISVLDYVNALRADCPTHIRITFINKGIVLTDQHIEQSGLRVNSILNGDTDLTIGRAVMSTVSIAILKGDHLNGIRWDDEIKVEVGLEVSETTYWVTIGYFTGTKRFSMATVDVIDYSANDRMQLFDVMCGEWLDSLTFPMTFEEMFHSLCAFVGLNYDDGSALPNIMSRSFAALPSTISDGMTCRDVLSYMAEACGCYARITANGDCQMFWYDTNGSGYTVRQDDQFNLEYFDLLQGKSWAELESYKWEDLEDLTWAEIGGYEKMFVVDALTVKQSATNTYVRYPSDTQNGNIYFIIDNPFLDVGSVADATAYILPIYERLSSFPGYLPMQVECVGNPPVESGDIIGVEIGDKLVNSPIFVKTMTVNTAVTDNYDITGEIRRELISDETYEKLNQGTKYTVQNDIKIANNQIEILPGGKLLFNEGAISNAIMSIPQALTNEQKEQARNNIGIETIFTKQMSDWLYGVNANNYTTPGVYGLADSCTNVPAGWLLIYVTNPTPGGVIVQFGLTGTAQYIRERRNGTWSNWNLIGGRESIYSKVGLQGSGISIGFSQLNFWLVGGMVTLSFVATLNAGISANTDYNITLSLTEDRLRPLFRMNYGGSNTPLIQKVNVIPGSGTTDTISFQSSSSISANTAFWLTVTYVCKG